MEKGLDKLVRQFAFSPFYQKYILVRSAVSLPGTKPVTPAVNFTPATLI